MSLAFKLSFVVEILAFFVSATFWAILLKTWRFFLIFWSPCLIVKVGALSSGRLMGLHSKGRLLALLGNTRLGSGGNKHISLQYDIILRYQFFIQKALSVNLINFLSRTTRRNKLGCCSLLSFERLYF